jgi:hypothetical protein
MMSTPGGTVPPGLQVLSPSAGTRKCIDSTRYTLYYWMIGDSINTPGKYYCYCSPGGPRDDLAPQPTASGLVVARATYESRSPSDGRAPALVSSFTTDLSDHSTTTVCLSCSWTYLYTFPWVPLSHEHRR